MEIRKPPSPPIAGIVSAVARWRIEMLGRLRATAGDLVVDRFPTRRTAALLAYLALHPDVQHSRDFLADLLWPEADLSSQKHSLRLALSRLRTLLGPNHPIEASRSHVWLKAEAVKTDVQELEDAIEAGDFGRAKSLMAGPLLPGIYDDWAIETQARLELLLEGIPPKSEALQRTIPGGLRRMIGRQADLDQIEDLLAQNSLVTITGIGGMGKTRLAAEFARFQDSSAWISLVDVTRPGQVPDAIRSAIRSPMPAEHAPLLPFVCRELANLAPVLLVLDNAEHLVGPELREVLEEVIAVPGVKVLATSRCSLGLANRAEHALKPLSDKAGAAVFKERVQSIRSSIQIPEDVLARIAERHGGIPLAIELGAARVGIQSIRDIDQGHLPPIDRLGESLGIPERHQSLAEVLQSSLQNLSDHDRQALSDLCVFRGGFDASAAEAVADADLGTLERLRKFGLLVAYDAEGETVRFRIPEPLRGIGLEQNQGSDARHAHYFAGWVAENRADHLPEPPFVFGSRLEAQNTERYNVEAALAFCAASEDVEIREAGLRIVAGFWTHWYTGNRAAEMEAWAMSLLAGAGVRADPKLQAAARLSLGLALRERGDYQGFAAQVAAARQALEGDESHRDAAFSWHLRGFSCSDLGKLAEADAAYVRAEAIWLGIGDLRNYSVTRHNRAMVALAAGKSGLAETFIWEALEIFNQHQSTYLGVGYSTLAQVFLSRNDLAGAADAFRNAALWNKKLGYVRGWAQNERDLALAVHQLGRREEAMELATTALSDFRRVGDRHGEATALSALSRISGEGRFADEARSLVVRHRIETHHELLKDLRSAS